MNGVLYVATLDFKGAQKCKVAIFPT